VRNAPHPNPLPRAERETETATRLRALKFKHQTEAEIPAELQFLQVERDGAWLLDVEGAVEKSKLEEFRGTNVALLKERNDLKQRFEGIDPDGVRKLAEEKRKLEEAQQLKAGKVDKVIEAKVIGRSIQAVSSAGLSRLGMGACYARSPGVSAGMWAGRRSCPSSAFVLLLAGVGGDPEGMGQQVEQVGRSDVGQRHRRASQFVIANGAGPWMSRDVGVRPGARVTLTRRTYNSAGRTVMRKSAPPFSRFPNAAP
jgi:hypothetical protein